MCTTRTGGSKSPSPLETPHTCPLLSLLSPPGSHLSRCVPTTPPWEEAQKLSILHRPSFLNPESSSSFSYLTPSTTFPAQENKISSKNFAASFPLLGFREGTFI